VLTFFIAGLLFICALSTSITWSVQHPVRRPAFSSHLFSAVTCREHNSAVSKRAWFGFAAIQTIGCILASYGTMYSESALVRGSWLIGFLLLLPGDLPGIALGQTLIHVRTAYIFFPVTVAVNAMLWIICSALWRRLRRKTPTSAPHAYTTALGVTGLVFIIANTAHFLRPATCADCFFPYRRRFRWWRGFCLGGTRSRCRLCCGHRSNRWPHLRTDGKATSQVIVVAKFPLHS